jgi:O-antigen/teichoic acid export membrane protein
MPDRLRQVVPKIAADTLWYSTAGTIGKGLALLSVPFLTRTLGPEDYGLVDLSTATSGLLAVVAMFSGDIPASRLAAFARTKDRRHSRYTEYIVAVSTISLAIAALVALSAGWIDDIVWASPGAERLVILSAALIPVTSMRAALANVHRLDGNARRFAMLTTLDVVAQLFFAVVFVWLGFGPYGAIIGFLVGGSMALIVAFATSYPLLTSRFAVNAVPELVWMGMPFLPLLVAFIGADYISRALIAGSLGQAAVGEFGLAIRISSVLALLTAAFQLAWSPRAAAMTLSPDTRRDFGQTLLGYAVFAGLLCLAVVAAAPEAVRLIAGKTFDGATTVLPGLALAAVLAGTHFILSMGSVVTGNTWKVATSSLAGAVVQILVTAISIGSLGLWGVGLAAAVGRATSVGILAPAVAHAFGRGFAPALCVLVAVAIACVVMSAMAGAPAPLG